MKGLDRIPKERPLYFLSVFFFIFFITSILLFVIDFVPEASENSLQEQSSAETAENAEARVAVPTRIVIKNIGVDTVINNPNTTTIEGLDSALLSGAVRYPGTARLGEKATMFLFGHQSYLPVVKNKAFKAFNDLQKLQTGDTIEVYSGTSVYEYQVEEVSLVDASQALIPLVQDEQILMLSTCNSFGDPGERYVVKARYSTETHIN